jgi:hypothetical protein
MNRFLFAVLLHHLSLIALLAAQSVTLAWDASPDATVTGYAVYYGEASDTLTNRVEAGDALTVAVTNLVAAHTYWFVAVAYDGDALESEPSNMISYQVPGPLPPGNLRIEVQSSTNLLGWVERAAFELPVTTLLQSEFWRSRMVLTPPPPLP